MVGEDLLGLEGQPAGGAGVARGEGVAALQVVAHVVPVPRHVLAHTAHTTTHVQDFLCFCIFRSFVCLFVCSLPAPSGQCRPVEKLRDFNEV